MLISRHVPGLYIDAPNSHCGKVNVQTAFPTMAPISAVSDMANAPQRVTRAAALKMFAPPALTPITPNSASKPRDAIEIALVATAKNIQGSNPS